MVQIKDDGEVYIGEYSSNRNDQEGKDGGYLVNRMTI